MACIVRSLMYSVTFLDNITERREKREYAEKGYLASHGSIPGATFEVNGMIPRVGGKPRKIESFKLHDDAGEEVWFSYDKEGVEQAWKFLEAAAQSRGEKLIRPAPSKVKSVGKTPRETVPRLLSWFGVAKTKVATQPAAV